VTHLRKRCWKNMILMTLYSTGMRCGEAVQLKGADIDKELMLVHIRAGRAGATGTCRSARDSRTPSPYRLPSREMAGDRSSPQRARIPPVRPPHSKTVYPPKLHM
jgi:integrase